jgi:hypothetical protein
LNKQWKTFVESEGIWKIRFIKVYKEDQKERNYPELFFKTLRSLSVYSNYELLERIDRFLIKITHQENARFICYLSKNSTFKEIKLEITSIPNLEEGCIYEEKCILRTDIGQGGVPDFEKSFSRCSPLKLYRLHFEGVINGDRRILTFQPAEKKGKYKIICDFPAKLSLSVNELSPLEIQIKKIVAFYANQVSHNSFKNFALIIALISFIVSTVILFSVPYLPKDHENS